MNLAGRREAERAELYEIASGRTWARYEIRLKPFSESFTIAGRPYYFNAGRVFLLDFTAPPPEASRGQKRRIPEVQPLDVTQVAANIPDIPGTDLEHFEAAVRKLAMRNKDVNYFIRGEP